MYVFYVPFNNNLAKRDIRIEKVKQKVSGAFSTQDGANTFCAIHFFISTACKQHLNDIEPMFDALPGDPFIPSDAMV